VILAAKRSLRSGAHHQTPGEATVEMITGEIHNDGARHEVVWLTWFWHRRTQGICDRWKIPLVIVPKKSRGALGRAAQAMRTLRALFVLRPRVLVVQNPSLGLTLLGIVCKPLFGYRLVVDAHNEAVHPFNRTGSIARALARWMLRAADLNIVTNSFLERDVEACGARSIRLPDPLPDVEPPGEIAPRTGRPEAFVIATHAPDEPTDALIGAAKQLANLVSFTMSGKAELARAQHPDIGDTIRLTGFLPEADYWRSLASADVIVDLTLMPDCLVCGAYEAVALAKPLVLSDNRAARELFGECAVFCDNSPASIAAAVRRAVEQAPQLAARSAEYRARYRDTWQRQASHTLREVVGLLPTPEPA
jgi:glycosyltransferase involved in cell wall biosynthesis